MDDYPYGGGAGMLMQAQPVYDAFLSVTKNLKGRMRPRVIYMAPQGRTFHQQMARELACEEDLIILCGHYEGYDRDRLCFNRRLRADGRGAACDGDD